MGHTCSARRVFRLSLFLPLLLAVGPATGDELWLKNGRKLEGVVVHLADGRVEIKTAMGRMILPGDRVERIERGESLEEAVATALGKLPGNDSQGRFELALFCQRQGAATLARRLFAEVVALEPDHVGARQALGFELFGGEWLTSEEVHVARGEVWFRERWMSPAERDRVLAWETAQALAAAESSRRQAEARELAARETRLAEAEDRARQAQQNPWWNTPCCAPTYPAFFWPRPVVKPPSPAPAQPPAPLPQRPIEHRRSRLTRPSDGPR